MRSMTIISLLLLSACAGNQPLYEWGSYPTGLRLHSRGSETSDQFLERLKSSIDVAEAKKRVPPGLYAEYGFLLLEQGRSTEAAHWLAKERATWPESAVLVDRLLAFSTAPSETNIGQDDPVQAGASNVIDASHQHTVNNDGTTPQ